MILTEPFLSLRRLSVFSSGKVVYDERFHEGLNVIRGHNAAGKSTIADFIFYALGGDTPSWKKAAERCDRVMAEIQLNRTTVTTRRDVNSKRSQAMQIFFGPMDEALRSADEGWQQFGFARYGERESYSQVLFKMLRMPEVRGLAEANITMHQLLRLMYVDQMSPVQHIFRFEQWDNPLIRQTVGDFLCGAYSPKVYSQELELRDAEKEFAGLESQSKSITLLLRKISGDMSEEAVLREMDLNALELKNMHEKIEKLQYDRAKDLPRSEHKHQSDDEAIKNLGAISNEIVATQNRIQELEFEIEDSKLFIEAISGKLEALHDSFQTRRSLGLLSFEHCPVCYSPVERQEPGDRAHHSCRLCKSPTTEKFTEHQMARMYQELDLQRKESQQLQSAREQDVSQHRARLNELYSLKTIQTESVQTATRSIFAHAERELIELYGRIGSAEQKMRNLSERLKLAVIIKENAERKSMLAAQILELRDSLSREKSQQESKRRTAYQEIESGVLSYLHRDLEREDTFKLANTVDFSFADNTVRVNGEANFSASSMVILRNSLHLSVLVSSINQATFRYPRFVLFDNIEDKGMEDVRSHQFQRIILDECRSAKSRFQVIFCTSKIAPELNVPEYVVGPFYTEERRTLLF